MKILNRYLIVFIVLVYFFMGRGVGFGFSDLLKGLRDKLFFDFILFEIRENHKQVIEVVGLYLDEITLLLQGKIYQDMEWMDKLNRENLVDGILFMEKERIFTFGSSDISFLPGKNRKEFFYVSTDKKLHHYYSNESRNIIIDIALNSKPLIESLETLERIPISISIYDRHSNFNSVIIGEKSFSPAEIVKIIPQEEYKYSLFGFKGVLFTQNLRLESSNLVVITLYPLELGKKFYPMIGLLVIIILTILLFGYTLKYTFLTQGRKARGEFDMGEEEKTSDIISEIDRKVSGVKEEQGVSIEEGEIKTEKDILKKLENDGIFIKKD